MAPARWLNLTNGNMELAVLAVVMVVVMVVVLVV